MFILWFSMMKHCQHHGNICHRYFFSKPTPTIITHHPTLSHIVWSSGSSVPTSRHEHKSRSTKKDAAGENSRGVARGSSALLRDGTYWRLARRMSRSCMSIHWRTFSTRCSHASPCVRPACPSPRCRWRRASWNIGSVRFADASRAGSSASSGASSCSAYALRT